MDSQNIFLAENGSEVTSESPAAVGMGMNMPIPDPVKVKVNHLVQLETAAFSALYFRAHCIRTVLAFEGISLKKSITEPRAYLR